MTTLDDFLSSASPEGQLTEEEVIRMVERLWDLGVRLLIDPAVPPDRIYALIPEDDE